MAERDKPFIMYKRGWGNVSIVPRNAQGWRETILWVLIVMPIIGTFLFWASRHAEGESPIIGVILFTVAMTAWGIGGIIWMRRRSEVVDFEELLALKRERDAEKRRGRR